MQIKAITVIIHETKFKLYMIETSMENETSSILDPSLVLTYEMNIHKKLEITYKFKSISKI